MASFTDKSKSVKISQIREMHRAWVDHACVRTRRIMMRQVESTCSNGRKEKGHPTYTCLLENFRSKFRKLRTNQL